MMMMIEKECGGGTSQIFSLHLHSFLPQPHYCSLHDQRDDDKMIRMKTIRIMVAIAMMMISRMKIIVIMVITLMIISKIVEYREGSQCS